MNGDTRSELETSFQLWFAHSPHPTWVYDQATLRFVQVNQAALADYGYSRDEFLALRVADICASALSLDERCSASQPEGDWFTGPERHRRRTGQVVDVHVVAHSITLAGRCLVLVVAQDITERKRAEDHMQQQAHDLAQIYRVSQTLASTLDLTKVIQHLMQAVTEITQAKGGSVWLWDKARTEELVCRGAFHPAVQQVLIGQHMPAGQGLVGWVAQNGKSALVPDVYRDVRFYPGIDAITGFVTGCLLAIPLRVRGQVIGVLQVVNKVGRVFDDHDLALVETLAGPAAIAIDNAQLVEALRDFASTLQARNEELDAFAHTVAHDLKAPLVPLIGFAEDLGQNYAKLTPQQVQRSLEAIMTSGHKMNNIIDELLLLAEVRKTDMRPERLDMADLVAQAQKRLADQITQHHAEIALPATWPAALGHGPWIEEVWVNYLSNALKYGGRPPRVELGAAIQVDGMARFWVRDNGNGLTPDDQSRLFTPFTRLDQVRARGHGLGLSIVRRIVEKLGGQVGVESPGLPGQGSLFFFTLPAA